MEATVKPRTEEGTKATAVILSIFRANGLLLSAGDRLAANEGLTSARWQVLGAIALAERPPTVPQIARRMGLTRQNVHVIVKRLVDDGLVELAANADHRRSQIVSLTDRGRAAYAALDARQGVWVSRVAEGIEPDDLDTAAHVLDLLCTRLEGGGVE